jgi:predicted dehydrogenase
MEKLRVGVIGPGGMGRSRTLEFVRRPETEVVAACDISSDVLDRLEKYLDEQVTDYKTGSIKRYVGDYEFMEMLDKEDLDIVGIFSPHSLHDIHARYAIRSGAHIVVEKPMANMVGDAIQMTKMALGSDRHIVVHYQRHYNPLYVTARRVFRDGLIGELKSFDVYLAQRWGGGGWRGDPRFSGGGQPNDSGSHLQDIFMWITGSLPDKVKGYTSKIFERDGKKVERPIEIDAVVDVEMQNGASGKISIYGNTEIGFREWVILKGEEGVLDIRNGVLKFRPSSGEEQEIDLERPDGYPQSNIDNLIGLIRDQYETNYTSSINGIRTSWLTNSILATGKGEGNIATADCQDILKREGTSLQEVVSIIGEAEADGRL